MKEIHSLSMFISMKHVCYDSVRGAHDRWELGSGW